MPPKKKIVPSFTTDWTSNKATTKSIANFEAMFGAEIGLGTLSRSDKIMPYEVVPTGMLALDYAVGIGGLPLGRIIEMWGPEHSGKTTSAMLMVASAQREYPDKMTAWVDMEQTFDKKWAKLLGVDLKRLWLVENPQTAEDVADATKRFVMSGLCSLVVLDSVGGMIARMEFEKEAGDSTVAMVAGIVTRMVKQCSPMGHSNGTITMVINQVRAIIGAKMGPQTHTGGGWALKHITTIRLNVRRGSAPKTITVDGKEVPIGYEMIFKVEKNKCAPYGKVANVWLYNQATDKNAVGVDPIGEVIEFGKRFGIIEGSTWLTMPNGEQFNGAAKATVYLKDHPEVVAEIRAKVLDTLSGVMHDETTDPAEDPTSMESYLAEVGS